MSLLPQGKLEGDPPMISRRSRVLLEFSPRGFFFRFALSLALFWALYFSIAPRIARYVSEDPPVFADALTGYVEESPARWAIERKLQSGKSAEAERTRILQSGMPLLDARSLHAWARIQTSILEKVPVRSCAALARGEGGEDEARAVKAALWTLPDADLRTLGTITAKGFEAGVRVLVPENGRHYIDFDGAAEGMSGEGERFLQLGGHLDTASDEEVCWWMRVLLRRTADTSWPGGVEAVRAMTAGPQ